MYQLITAGISGIHTDTVQNWIKAAIVIVLLAGVLMAAPRVSKTKPSHNVNLLANIGILAVAVAIIAGGVMWTVGPKIVDALFG